jgi:hypothetical protein
MHDIVGRAGAICYMVPRWAASRIEGAVIRHVFVYYETTDSVAAEYARLLFEGGRTWNLDKRWSVRADPPHHTNMKAHLHIMFRGDDKCIINRDGTPSHHTTTDAIPGG